jgi:hypothetical protein
MPPAVIGHIMRNIPYTIAMRALVFGGGVGLAKTRKYETQHNPQYAPTGICHCPGARPGTPQLGRQLPVRAVTQQPGQPGRWGGSSYRLLTAAGGCCTKRPAACLDWGAGGALSPRGPGLGPAPRAFWRLQFKTQDPSKSLAHLLSGENSRERLQTKGPHLNSNNNDGMEQPLAGCSYWLAPAGTGTQAGARHKEQGGCVCTGGGGGRSGRPPRPQATSRQTHRARVQTRARFQRRGPAGPIRAQAPEPGSKGGSDWTRAPPERARVQGRDRLALAQPPIGSQRAPPRAHSARGARAHAHPRAQQQDLFLS